MTTQVNYETAAQTAKKVREVLKREFPKTKFSVKSSTYSMGSSILVSWTDGPAGFEVVKAVGFMGSSQYEGRKDHPAGYYWKGDYYSGASYVQISRQQSEEYKAIVLQQLRKLFEPDQFGNYRPMDWEAAELQLINSGKLGGAANGKQ